MKNVIRIISRDLWELSEPSIEIFDFFNKKISKTQKMLLFWQFLSENRFFWLRELSKRKDLIKIWKVIFNIKLIPSHLWWESNTKKTLRRKIIRLNEVYKFSFKTVSLNQRNFSWRYGQRTFFFIVIVK